MINPAILLNETRWWEVVSLECAKKTEKLKIQRAVIDTSL
jgi:hypothetical protein